MYKCIIMAGGKGTRFWPVSTKKKPKQYINLATKNSLLEETIFRLSDVVDKGSLYVCTVKEQLQLAIQNGAGVVSENEVIVEPEGRNTAPCIFLSLLRLLKDGHTDDSVVAVLPSDHIILDKHGFTKTLKKAGKLSHEEKKIVTIGIKASSPHTGYGYIKRGNRLGEGFLVDSFKEKPDFETAKSYQESGEYFWNAGMFIAPIRVLIEEFKKHGGQYFQLKDEILENIDNDQKLIQTYQKLPKDSIDYAIMEKSSEVAVVEAEFDWNDLGAWDAISDVLKEKNENYLVSQKSFRQIDASNNIIFAPDKKVSLIGVKDLVVVVEGDEVMVLPKSMAQKVKELAN